ncbi:hypothetical protein ACIQ1H_14365 [Lysinibacillus sp. NPDC097279]|nr:hypothetical protein [Lysinibacillus sp. CD3-6]QPQ33440.1 hypothetical protein JNUCC52_11935 [Lysinibacillus sp. JNUCC-52]UED80630.1 hypothetical protein FH508_0001680 [Lysinibacillus sp. CD3-6]
MEHLFNSKFETYLMDQESELQTADQKIEEQPMQIHYEEYPEGFFTSL